MNLPPADAQAAWVFARLTAPIGAEPPPNELIQAMAEPYRSLVSGDAWPKPEAGPDEESEAETKVIPLRRRKRQ